MEDQSNGDGIGARARTAVGWQALSQLSTRGARVLVSIVLARLLMPDDFGVVGMAAIVTGLAVVLRDLGFGQALIHHPDLTEKHSRSAFWATMLTAGTVYAIIYFIAPWTGEYFEDPRMVPVLRVMALSFLITPFSVVPRSLLQREIDFKRPFFANLAETTAYGVVGITTALLGFGYWALVWALLSSTAVGAVALCLIMGYVPPLIPSLRGAGELAGFGVGVSLNGVVNRLAQQIDYIIIGRRLDSSALGLYTNAFMVTHLPMQGVAGVLFPVMFSSFARITDDDARVCANFKPILSAVALVTFPILAAIAITAPELIPSLLGEQWRGAVVPIRILAFAGMLRCIINPSAAVARAYGVVYSQAWRNTVYALSLGVGAWYASQWGIVGVAWAALGATTIVWILNVQLLLACCKMPLRTYLMALASPVICATITGGAGQAVRYFAAQYDLSEPVTAILSVAACIIGAVAWLLFDPWGEGQRVLQKVSPRIAAMVGAQKTSDTNTEIDLEEDE
jgi:PST family polysaccharide transporter